MLRMAIANSTSDNNSSCLPDDEIEIDVENDNDSSSNEQSCSPPRNIFSIDSILRQKEEEASKTSAESVLSQVGNSTLSGMVSALLMPQIIPGTNPFLLSRPPNDYLSKMSSLNNELALAQMILSQQKQNFLQNICNRDRNPSENFKEANLNIQSNGKK